MLWGRLGRNRKTEIEKRLRKTEEARLLYKIMIPKDAICVDTDSFVVIRNGAYIRVYLKDFIKEVF